LSSLCCRSFSRSRRVKRADGWAVEHCHV
jgi:hypothetical protein